MKKPTLRLRQVFEGPTHFKVVKPLGNPIKIAKKGLSPSLMGRLRKYAEGTPDEPVQPPTDEEVAIADQMKAQAYVPAGSDIPVSAGEGSFGVPALEPAPVASVVGASVPDLELPEPAPVAPVTAPVVAAPVTPVVAPAAAPAAPVVVVQAAQPAPVAAPEPPKPTAEEVRQQRVDAYMAAFEKQEVDRVAAANAQALKIADINVEAQEQARQAVMRAKGLYAGKERALSEFDAPREMTGGDVARSIGSALSVALGAFASGMTGMPNFALKIYEDALARDLLKQREQRNSILKQMEIAGLSVEDAEKMYRAQKDKEFATRLDLAAQSTTNPKAREEARKAAFQFAQKAAVDEADIQKKVAETFKATKQGELAVEQAAVVKPEQKTKEAREERENLKLYFDQLDKLLDRQQRGEISQNELDVERLKIKKTFDAAMAGVEAKKKDEQVTPDMGAPIPDFLKGAKSEELRKYRVEYEMPVRKSDGTVDAQRNVGFLTNPQDRAEFQKRMFGLKVAEGQVNELRDWVQKNPGGIVQVALRDGPVAALAAKEELEPLVKTAIEGYISNVTGVRRASTSAINLMKGVLRDPSSFDSLMRSFGTKGARWESILEDIERGKDALRESYLVGGAPRSAEATVDRGVPQRRSGQ
jgi:hypothetical protein